MSTPRNLPQWLKLSIDSGDHVHSVLRILASRESKRSAARRVSQRQALEAVNASSDDRVDSSPKREINLEHVRHYSVAVGVHEDNRFMNRYIDIIPYDRTRVVVGAFTGNSSEGTGQHGRYLNANWILERYGHKWWIAMQAPLRHTAHAFMSLMLSVIEPPHIPSSSSPHTSQIRTVVQLTQNIEGGRRKADPYFPTEVGQSAVILPEAEEDCHDPPLKVTLLQTQFHKDAHCVQSTVSIAPFSQRSSGHSSIVDKEVIFNHMLYSSWPDHGVPDPEDKESLLAFVKLVDQINRDNCQCGVHPDATPGHPCTKLDPDPPIAVNCSAGIGRTGSFLAISSLLRKYGFLPPAAHPASLSPTFTSPLGPLPDDLKDDLILQEIDSLREQRPGMVQRAEQVLLVYELLADAFAETS